MPAMLTEPPNGLPFVATKSALQKPAQPRQTTITLLGDHKMQHDTTPFLGRAKEAAAFTPQGISDRLNEIARLAPALVHIDEAARAMADELQAAAKAQAGDALSTGGLVGIERHFGAAVQATLDAASLPNPSKYWPAWEPWPHVFVRPSLRRLDVMERAGTKDAWPDEEGVWPMADNAECRAAAHPIIALARDLFLTARSSQGAGAGDDAFDEAFGCAARVAEVADFTLTMGIAPKFGLTPTDAPKVDEGPSP